MTEFDGIHDDGFRTGGFAPPPEMEYARDGAMTKPMHVMSVPTHPILIHWVLKPNVWSSEAEPNVCDGSPPPRSEYAMTMDEAYPLMLIDGFLMWLPWMASVTDGVQPAATTDGFRLRASDGSQPQSRMEMTDGERPAAMVTDGVEPAAMCDESRLRAGDGSPPRNRMEEVKATDGVQPAAGPPRCW
jgi:hypothetical protein